MTLTKLAARIRRSIPWLRCYLDRGGSAYLFWGAPTLGSRLYKGGRIDPATNDWQPMKALQDWSVS